MRHVTYWPSSTWVRRSARFVHRVERVTGLHRKSPNMRKFTTILSALAVMMGAAFAMGSSDQTAGWHGGGSQGGNGSGSGSGGGWHGGHGGGGHRGGGGGYGGYGGGYGGGVYYPYPYWPGSPYPAPYPFPYPDSPNSTPPPDKPPVGAYNASSNMPPWPFWYYCDNPEGYYPYVKTCTHDWSALPMMAPPPTAGPPLSDGKWEWCEEAKGYYPYIKACPKGFVAVAVTAPQSENTSETPPAIANWFYCDEPKGYLPYVSDCKRDWRVVPSMPPPHSPVTTKTSAVTTKKPAEGH